MSGPYIFLILEHSASIAHANGILSDKFYRFSYFNITAVVCVCFVCLSFNVIQLIVTKTAYIYKGHCIFDH